ncbi:MAG: chromosome partitioning protein [Pseudonocardiales bacterium]|nr:MAG: chromosome partitioning protein [Pseudonocardiales bacterium]
MVGVELVAGYLVARAVVRARRVAQRLEGEVDQVLDAGLDRLHEVVAVKLGGDPALAELQEEAIAGGEVRDQTRHRVALAIQAAAASDPAFNQAVEQALIELTAVESATTGRVWAAGERTVAVGRDVDVRAEGGSAAALTMGEVTVGVTSVDPTQPGRSSD